MVMAITVMMITIVNILNPYYKHSRCLKETSKCLYPKVNPWHGLLKPWHKSLNLWLGLVNPCHGLTNTSSSFVVWMLRFHGMHIEERKNGTCVIFCRKWVKSMVCGRIWYNIFCRKWDFCYICGKIYASWVR